MSSIWLLYLSEGHWDMASTQEDERRYSWATNLMTTTAYFSTTYEENQTFT